MADSRVTVWKFSNVSGTDSVPIIRGTQSVPENSKNFDTLTWLSARGHFIEQDLLVATKEFGILVPTDRTWCYVQVARTE